MNNEITILPIGTKVKFGDEKQVIFEGKITAVTIRKCSVIYQIFYWLLSDFKEIWLLEDDFTVVKHVKKQKIGFKDVNEETP